MPTSLLFNWRVWAVVAMAVMLAASHWKAYKLGGAEVSAALGAEKLDVSKQTLRLMENNTRTSGDLQDNADKLRKTKDAKITKLNDALTIALNGLRDRPSRTGESDLPSPTGAAASCTGASLFRQDAEFLVREAGRADQLRADLAECQAFYSNARDALK